MELSNIFTLFFAGIVFGLIGGALLLANKNGSSENSDASGKSVSDVQAEMMKTNLMAFQNQQLMKTMQLDNLRMETEMMELQERKLNLLSGNATREKRDREQSMRLLLGDIRDAANGRDISNNFDRTY